MIKIVSVNQIEITTNGTVQIRIKLSIIEGQNEISSKWHRSSFYPGCNIDEQFSAINNHLIQMGYEAISIADIDKVKTHCNASWTPEAISAYQNSISSNVF